MLLGAIADDYTGGADLAGMLAGQGVRTVQFFGVPPEALLEEVRARYEAAVVCLKSRSIEAGEACRMACQALDWLARLDPAQVQFKYCSTFDSTSKGNIGPVTAALLERMNVDSTIAVPALPVNGRTQYFGCLFVNGVPLAESPMRHHPLNPMTDSNLVRHLQAQTGLRVGLVAHPVVRKGAAAIREEMAAQRAQGVRIALVDAIVDADLEAIAEAVACEPLITGGSGISEKLPAAWMRRGWWKPGGRAPRRLGGDSRGVLALSGSCSAATLGQLEAWRGAGWPVIEVDVGRLPAAPEAEMTRLAGAARLELEARGRALVSSSAPAERREPGAAVSAAIERCLGGIARRLCGEAGIRRLIVAGGETAGAALEALGVRAVEILDILDPGVPALCTLEEPRLGLALKSGNFGAPDFFDKAARYLEAL